MTKLKLVFTRPVIVPSIMGWYEGIGQYLKREVGVGMMENVLFFQDGVMKSYRSERQLVEIRKFIIRNPETVIRHLESANLLYKNLVKYGKNLTEEKLRGRLELLDDFYLDFLASFKPNFFSLWAPELVKEEELGVYGKTIFKLAKRTRAALDPFVFAGRFYLKIIEIIGKDKNLLSLCTHKEIKRYLQNKLSVGQRQDILERKKGWVMFGQKSKVVQNFFQAQLFIRQFGFMMEEQSPVIKLNEFKGQVAARGKAKGRVKILFRYQDNKKVKKGDILVSPMTTPAFMPAIRKAAAIITNEGGITCHAAIISREMEIPCIIATKIATQVLKDGDLVEVDANKGIVKKL